MRYTVAALTRWLSRKFGEGLRIGYDIDAIPALAEARTHVGEANCRVFSHAQRKGRRRGATAQKAQMCWGKCR